MGNLQDKTNLYRRTCSVIYFAIVPPWRKQNRHRIGIAVFHVAIKKVQLVQTMKKSDFLISRPISLRGINAIRRDTGKHFTITDATTVCSLHFKREHLKRNWTTELFLRGSSFRFRMERSSPRKRPPPKIRASPFKSRKDSCCQSQDIA